MNPQQEDDLPRAAELAKRNQPGADGDGDQDMDTDDHPRAGSITSSGNNSISDSSTMVATAAPSASSSPSSSSYNTVPSIAAVSNTTSEIIPDYNELSVPRESLMAMVPRTHRHRVYAAQGGLPLQYYNHYNQYPHHYTLRHHLHYNPFTYRKFPPYQHWAASAQRDYHWKTLGITDLFPDRRREGAAAGAGPPPPPPPGAAGQVVLRSTAGNAGVNKTVFRSRLPVHLRHLTARANRRAAIFTNPFREGGGEDAMSTEQDTIIGPSSRGRAAGRAAAGGEGGGMHGEEGEESGHHLMTSNLGMENLSISSSSSSSTSASPRKRIVEWRRLKDDYGKIMRLASNDIITTATTGSSSTSSPSSSSSLASGRRGNNRVWTNQRGGLANILLAKQHEDNGSGSGSGSGAGPSNGAVGSGASTVDRLVEEMNKWTV
ncbi:MAG: hypothetical protein J3Q66DRAFT_352294 [Benniella sp.]|nr:MAG: hypothetical protein J3Q66DRAFT_352294 [Benniella sp.]